MKHTKIFKSEIFRSYLSASDGIDYRMKLIQWQVCYWFRFSQLFLLFFCLTDLRDWKIREKYVFFFNMYICFVKYLLMFWTKFIHKKFQIRELVGFIYFFFQNDWGKNFCSWKIFIINFSFLLDMSCLNGQLCTKYFLFLHPMK